MRKAQSAAVLGQVRPPLRAEPDSEEAFPKDDEEPNPKELAKEKEALRSPAAAGSIAVAEVEAEERVLESRSQQRASYGRDTTFKLYLREIGQVKLLTPREEIELGIRIKRGDKKARERMIKASLRLVVKIAREYEDIGLPLLDLISEGNIGLIKAVERFDPAKGGRFSTYGAWWIRQAIKRALANQSNTARAPIHLADEIARMRRAALRLQEEPGRGPTDEELGQELELTARRVAAPRDVRRHLSQVFSLNT